MEEILENEVLNEEEPVSYTPDVIEYSVYARVDKDNKVVSVFSDCFAEPEDTDIFVKRGSGDEFVHVGYYELLNGEFAHLYKVVDGEITRCTEEEIAEEIASKRKLEAKPTIEESIAAIEDAICELSMRMN